MRRCVLVGAALIALLAGIYSASRTAATSTGALPRVAPEVLARFFASSFDTADGQPSSFAQWRGKTLVVNFWATWCPPCRQEIPLFSRLHERYAEQGVQFVGIALDSADEVRFFAARLPVSYPLLIGGAAGVELASALGDVSLGLPYTVVISGEGEVLLRQLGPLSENVLEQTLRRKAARESVLLDKMPRFAANLQP